MTQQQFDEFAATVLAQMVSLQASLQATQAGVELLLERSGMSAEDAQKFVADKEAYWHDFLSKRALQG